MATRKYAQARRGREGRSKMENIQVDKRGGEEEERVKKTELHTNDEKSIVYQKKGIIKGNQRDRTTENATKLAGNRSKSLARNRGEGRFIVSSYVWITAKSFSRENGLTKEGKNGKLESTTRLRPDANIGFSAGNACKDTRGGIGQEDRRKRGKHLGQEG